MKLNRFFALDSRQFENWFFNLYSMSFLSLESFDLMFVCNFQGASIPFLKNPGSHLLSHTVSSIVSSAVRVLTIVFGMGTGVTPGRIAAGKSPYGVEPFYDSQMSPDLP